MGAQPIGAPARNPRAGVGEPGQWGRDAGSHSRGHSRCGGGRHGASRPTPSTGCQLARDSCSSHRSRAFATRATRDSCPSPPGCGPSPASELTGVPAVGLLHHVRAEDADGVHALHLIGGSGSGSGSHSSLNLPGVRDRQPVQRVVVFLRAARPAEPPRPAGERLGPAVAPLRRDGRPAFHAQRGSEVRPRARARISRRCPCGGPSAMAIVLSAWAARTRGHACLPPRSRLPARARAPG